MKQKFADPCPEDEIEPYPRKIDPAYAKAKILYEDELCVAFTECSDPAAPVHFLVAPKVEGKAKSFKNLADVGEGDAKLMGHMMVVVAKVAAQQGLANGYRTVINNGKSACQTVDHLLIQVIGGQQLHWPPDGPAVQNKKEEAKTTESTQVTEKMAGLSIRSKESGIISDDFTTND